MNMTNNTNESVSWNDVVRAGNAAEKAAAMSDEQYATSRETLAEAYHITVAALDSERDRLKAEKKVRDDHAAALKQAIKDGADKDQIKAMKDAHRRTQEAASIVLECFANLTPAETKWLWSQKIPLARLIVFSGNPDCGKSVTTCDLIARFTNGRDWPDGAKNINAVGEVLMLLAEDDPNEDTLPRLMAAGADVSKVHFLKMVEIGPKAKRQSRRLALDTDLDLVRKMLKEHPNIKVIVADPITGYFGNCNMNKEQEIRAILEPLRDLCLDCEITFIAIIHFNKRSDVDVIHRVSGAVSLTGVPRAVWAFGPDLDVPGEYLMTSVKGNKAKNKRGLRYSIVEKMTVVGGQPVISWLGDSEKTAEDMVARKDTKERQIDKAIALLRSVLTPGKPELAGWIEKRAEAEGISLSTLDRAKKSLRITTKQKGGSWQLCLPVDDSKIEPDVSKPEASSPMPFG